MHATTLYIRINRLLIALSAALPVVRRFRQPVAGDLHLFPLFVVVFVFRLDVVVEDVLGLGSVVAQGAPESKVQLIVM